MVHATVVEIKNLVTKGLYSNQRNSLAEPVSSEEIKIALFSIPSDKAPGPDG